MATKEGAPGRAAVEEPPAVEEAPPERPLAVLVLVLALLAAGLSLALTSWHGAGVASDGANYVSAARSVLAGQGFVQSDGAPLALWPPLEPLLLAAPGLL